MSKHLIKNARIVTDFNIVEGDLLVENGKISKIDRDITPIGSVQIHEGHGKYLIPGVIDDQVHFREPGLTHKANIYTESRAALVGGTTSFMEMPNVNPQTVTNALLEEKYALGAQSSAVNYSFYLGGTNDNVEEVKRVNPRNVCGVKLFMGSSTGNMLVDQEQALNGHFAHSPILIATHCESEARVKQRYAKALEKFGDNIPPSEHPIIRDAEACYLSSSFAIELAKKHNTRLHILHITTEMETHLFRNDIPLAEKRITAEVCVHHLHYSSADYQTLGHLIKCNPAVKSADDRAALWKALLDDRFDVIATDHAPHTWEEKQNTYPTSPSGLPLVQHALSLMMDYVAEGRMSIEKMVEKMCHNPAILYQIEGRGYLREGYAADMVLLSENHQPVTKESLQYKCGWSPLEGHTFKYAPEKVWVNGALSFDGAITTDLNPQRLLFVR
ncbi:MAG: dihydroorotase [Sphingomonadales bacterium]|nr:dihydroorotase [Sphingomonadales bacterium]